MIDAAIHVWDSNEVGPGHSAQELLTTLDQAGVWGAMCIHSRRDSGYDHTATLRAITNYPQRLAGVCVVPPDVKKRRRTRPTTRKNSRANCSSFFEAP